MIRIASRLLAARLFLQRLFHVAEWQSMLLWAVAAGLLGALATELFRLLLHVVDQALFGRGDNLVAIARSLPWWLRCTVPALGGLGAGGLLVLAKRATVQQATSDYMEAVVLGDGRIPVVQTLARTSSSLLSIASGGSIGREGSMVQLAAMSVSLLGQRLHFPIERLRLLVACGAAAGITAAYNAPIAGAFFIAEIVLGSIAMESVGPVLIASVVSNIAMRQFSASPPPYEMPPFPAISGAEIVLFALLGVLLGAGSALFLRGLRGSREAFNRLPLALPWRLALGGLAVGLISIPVPEVWGNGYSVVNAVLHTPWPWTLLAGVFVAKAAATLATAGSGAVGGVFTPALFFGCLAGALFGIGVQGLWPHATSQPYAYAIAGMGAFLAGATQAPLMSILMIFEMTLSYQVMLPLMTSSVIAYFVARSLRAGSMYEITVKREEQRDEHLRLRTLLVRDLVQPADTVVGPQADLDQMSRFFLKYPVKYLYVVDEAGRYLGVVPLKALGAGRGDAALAGRCAADLLTPEIAPLTEGMALGEALQRFVEHQGERLPVVRAQGDPVLVGVVHKTSLLQTYVRLSEGPAA